MINNPSHPKKGHLKSKDCRFTKAGVEYIDYKQTDVLERFVNDQGKILPRRVTGSSARVLQVPAHGISVSFLLP